MTQIGLEFWILVIVTCLVFVNCDLEFQLDPPGLGIQSNGPFFRSRGGAEHYIEGSRMGEKRKTAREMAQNIVQRTRKEVL